MERITITSGKIIVSDPCYSEDTCSSRNRLEVPAVNGEWEVHQIMEDGVVTELVAFAVNEESTPSSFWEVTGLTVDSGRMGIYDGEYFMKNKGGRYCESETFYGRICDGTQNGHDVFGIDNSGAVCISGYGDGYYQVSYEIDAGNKCVGVRVNFMDYYEESEE